METESMNDKVLRLQKSLDDERIKTLGLERDKRTLSDTNVLLNKQILSIKGELGKSHLDIIGSSTVIAHAKTIGKLKVKLGNWRVISFMLGMFLAASGIYIGVS